MSLGGYHRLWIVSSLVYLGVVIIYVVMIWPNPLNISNKSVFYESLPDKVKNIIINTPLSDELAFIPEKSNPVEMPNKYIIYFKTNTSLEDMRKASAEYWKQVNKESFRQKIRILSFGVMFWIIPCLVIYILAFSINWIIQGFKNHR